MSYNLETHFFLGSNAPGGFVSLYNKFVDSEKDKLNIIKGGPGCGKSTFMRRIADAAIANGLSVEKICCSGDPDSLDAIYIPYLRLGYVDGTAPHIMEPVFAGVTGTDGDGAQYTGGGIGEARERRVCNGNKAGRRKGRGDAERAASPMNCKNRKTCLLQKLRDRDLQKACFSAIFLHYMKCGGRPAAGGA